MEKTIKVTGKGKISVKPDRTRLMITHSAVEQIYETAVKESADRKNELNSELQKLGFNSDNLKTVYFNVNTEYEYYQNENGIRNRRLLGYRYTHRLKLEFASDNTLLGKVLSAVLRCSGQPEISIQYTVSNPDSAREELLAKAVEDSKRKADILSRAAGVSLKEIISINYSWDDADFAASPVSDMILSRSAELYDCEHEINIDIEADNIDMTDTVTVIWSIEKS